MYPLTKPGPLRGLFVCTFLLVTFSIANQYQKSPLIHQDTTSENGAIADNDEQLASLMQDIQQREYFIQPTQKANRYQSPNRKQNIRTYYEPGLWTMRHRNSGDDWRLTFRTAGLYADGVSIHEKDELKDVTVNRDQIDFEYTHYVEQYINNQAGVRQNFIIREAIQAFENSLMIRNPIIQNPLILL